MRQPTRIFIIGHPGAGKALLAKTLAEKLGWTFINADFELEFKIGESIENILGDQGNQHFQKKQHDIIRMLQQKEYIVVTTDTSIASTDAVSNILENEFVVYLKVSTPIQITRAQVSRNQQPLLLETDLAKFLEVLHQTRDERFEKMANLIIDSDDNALESHVQSILNHVFAEKIETPIMLQEKVMIIMHNTLHSPVELTKQQASCLKLLADGQSAKEIAEHLRISHRTAEGHIKKLMEILGCSSSKELVKLYFYKP